MGISLQTHSSLFFVRMAVHMTLRLLIPLALASPSVYAQLAVADAPASTSPDQAGEPAVLTEESNVTDEGIKGTERSPHPLPDATTMLQLQRDFISALQELNTALQTVKDKASADAAAEQVGRACSRILELIDTGKSYGRPDEKTAALLERAAARSGLPLEEYAKTALTRILTVYFHNCHGSKVLCEAVQPFMDEMLVGADALDEGSHQVQDVPDVAQQK